jgi:hypothetical protein
VPDLFQTRSKSDPTCPPREANLLPGGPFPRETLSTQERQESVIPQVMCAVAQQLERIYRQSPGLAETSAPVTRLAEASVRRALALHAHGALDGKDVILLGDDDLVSLAVGFLGQALGRALARRIVVVEADPAWVKLIQAASRAHGLDVECVRHNLRDPLPEDLCGAFDTFETDPPYTAAGMTLFVSRAIQALKPGAGQQGLLVLGHKSPAELLDVQSHLVRMGLVTREVLPASGESGDSQILVLLTTPATKAVFPQVPYEGSIYAGETSPLVCFYVCTRCKARYRVGQQYSFVTAESLKAAGCSRCGHTRFRYVRRIAVQPNRLPSDESLTTGEGDRRSWDLLASDLFARVREAQLDRV